MGHSWNTQLELGQRQSSSSSRPTEDTTSGLSRRGTLYSTLSSWVTRTKRSLSVEEDCEAQPEKEYAAGYPRFSALIASHNSFHVFRRFSNLRTRLLLLKQDRLSKLEARLEKVDREEVYPLRLGCSRADDNTERKAILSDIETALSEYDELLKRNHEILRLETAKQRDISNLKNWIDDNGCIAREETAYLGCQELISVAAPEDSAVTWFEDVVGAALVLLQKCLGKSARFSISKDPNVHIFPQLALTRTARLLMTPFLISLLLGPVIICRCLGSLNARLFVIVAATTAFIGVLSGLTRAKANELAVAGAT